MPGPAIRALASHKPGGAPPSTGPYGDTCVDEADTFLVDRIPRQLLGYSIDWRYLSQLDDGSPAPADYHRITSSVDCVGAAGPNNDVAAIAYCDQELGPDHFVEWQFGVFGNSGNNGWCIRFNPAVSPVQGWFVYGDGAGNLQVKTFSSDSRSSAVFQDSYVQGDVCRLETQGNEVRLVKNTVVIDSTVDPLYQGGTYAGFFRYRSRAAIYNNVVFGAL